MVWKRLLTVLTDPAGTFASVGERPRLLVPWLVQGLAALACALAVMSRVREAMRAEVLNAPVAMPEAMAATIERVTLLSAVLLPPVILGLTWLFWGGLLWLTSRHLEGAAPYLAHVSMVAHAAVPVTLRGIVTAVITPLLPGHQVADTSAALLLPPPEGAPPLAYAALARLDLFLLWTLGLTVMGYAVINRVPGRRAVPVVVGLWLAGVVLSLVASTVGARLASVP